MGGSGAKYMGVAVLMVALGVVCAYLVDQTHDPVMPVMVFSAIILCLGGVGLFLLGLYKVIAGLVSGRQPRASAHEESAAAGEPRP
jgi:hypothetical protein